MDRWNEGALRASLGKERVDAAREELARLEGAAGLPKVDPGGDGAS